MCSKINPVRELGYYLNAVDDTKSNMIHMPSLFVARSGINHSLYIYCILFIHMQYISQKNWVFQPWNGSGADYIWYILMTVFCHVIVWHHFMPMGGDFEICHQQLCFGWDLDLHVECDLKIELVNCRERYLRKEDVICYLTQFFRKKVIFLCVCQLPIYLDCLHQS